MSSQEKNDAGRAFVQVCTERHVPMDVWAQIVLELPKNAGTAEKNDYFGRATEQVKRDWPFIPMEEYLAQIEESKDWKDLLWHRRVYWQDVPSMLADAVRTRSVQTVRQLALHCLLGNPQLKEEMLALAPDQRTRKALLYPPRVKEEKHYEQYPFCIVENGVVDIRSIFPARKKKVRIITMPPDIQERVFERFLCRNGYTVGQLAGCINADRAELEEFGMKCSTRLDYILFCMGYEMADQGFISRPIPECWYQHEWAQEVDFTDDEIFEKGVLGLCAEVIHQGWKVTFEGINNCFGCTGYSYLTQWP